MNPIKKAVFPVAGLGTRFLPATKAMPKEMLPVNGKPLIQYVVEEAVAAGVTDLIFITGRGKRAIEDHFDSAPELEMDLSSKGKQALLDEVRGILPSHVNCIFIRQPAALGLGHAVLCAEPVVGNEPFAVLLADDLIDSDGPGAIHQLIQVAHQYNGTVLGVQTVPAEHISRYGVVAGKEVDAKTLQLNNIVEKPAAKDAPSDKAVVGRYVLTPEIFEHLRRVEKGVGGEIQLTDGIASLLKAQPVFSHVYEGVRYDCGNKDGFLRANLAIAQKYDGFVL